MIVPDKLIQNDSLHLSFPIPPNFSPDLGFTCKLALLGTTNKTLTALVIEKNYKFKIKSTDADYESGPYSYVVYFENVDDGIRHVYEQGNTIVYADPLTAVGVDHRSHNKRMLEAVEAYIERRATNNQIDHLKTIVQGDQLERMNFKELQELRQRYRRLVAIELNKFPKQVNFKFVGVY